MVGQLLIRFKERKKKAVCFCGAPSIHLSGGGHRIVKGATAKVVSRFDHKGTQFLAILPPVYP